MKIFKFLLTICLFGAGLTFMLVLFIHILSIKQINLFGDDREPGEEDENQDVAGITINSLYENSLADELLFYLNGIDEPVIMSYKLSTSREKTLETLSGGDLDYFFPGKVVIADNENLYWVKQESQEFQIIKTNLSNFTNEEKVLYTAKNIDQLVGIKVLDNGDLYFTEYTGGEGDVYNYSIIRIREGETVPVFQASAIFPQVVAGSDEKGRPITRIYDPNTNSIGGDCKLLENQEQIGCEQLDDLEYFLQTTEPTSEGYYMNQKGYIQVTNKKSTEKVILEGQIDEHFESLYYKAGYIYFISGTVESATSDTSSKSNFGSFNPIALERIKIDGTERETLKVLPSSLYANIKYVDDKYLLLTISELSSNKYDIKPANIWLFDFNKEKLAQLTDIECDQDEYCEAVFLQERN